MESISGTVERITFFNAENGYTVVKILPENSKRFADAAAKDGTVAIVGVMPELNIGESVEFTGEWITDPRWGKQFRAETTTPIAPTTKAGIINYLGSGLVKGIGTRTAEKIVAAFGEKTLDILDHEPDRLYSVPGLKEHLAERLIEAWKENRVIRQAMIFLQGYGVSSRMAARICKHYGFATVKVVQDNPYALADEVFGIGFIKADTVARSMGIGADDKRRLRAGLAYTLNQLSRDGHVYSPRAELIAKASELLGTESIAGLQAALSQQLLTGDLVADSELGGEIGDDAIYLPHFFRAERGAATRLRRMIDTPSMLAREADKLDWTPFLAKLSKRNEIRLTDQQQGAVRAALTQKVSVLTGGPGTGKTTTLRMVIEALEALGYRCALASPTGRAAKRLSEATSRPASTIHRLLGYAPQQGFEHNEDNPLKLDLLVVDETSMVDLLLFNDLLKALPPTAHLLLVGDADQLPSVGAGNVLRDIISSGVIPVTRLDVIFRQSDDSHIIVNAHRVNQGEVPHTDNRSADFFFFGEDDPVAAAQLVVDIVKNRLPARFDCDPLNDVQVIAPMYRGQAGIDALNTALQAELNSDKRRAEKPLGGRVFRVGDKVMQTRNDYMKEVFNGDIGRIQAIDFENGTFEVVIDGRFIDYEWSEAAEDLIHAYCISTHRSQGSEYPIVVMPVLTQHYMMLQRNLLYTAITRAKKTVVLVGSRKAIHMAVQNDRVAQRYSGLPQRLKGKV
jgi:exodeoxyribonuclease V alpha subunit